MRLIFATLILSNLIFAQTIKPTKIVFLGDSITEGYGVAPSAAFPTLVEKKLKSKNKNIEIVNAGISASTSASGESRLRWILKSKPDMVVIALGANDGLRGLSTQALSNNLSNMIKRLKESKVKIVLAGMKMPPNYGKDYTVRFEKVYKDLAKKEKIPFIPFLLEGVAGDKNLNQQDGIHPNEKGHEVISNNVTQFLENLL